MPKTTKKKTGQAAIDHALHKESRYRIDAVDRALVLLNKLAEKSSATASQLAVELDANRSLVYRLLNTLADRGFVRRDADHVYRLGPRMLYLGRQAEHASILIDVSRDILDRLSAETGENIGLGVRDGLELVSIASRKSTRPVSLVFDVGLRGPLYRGGGAKLLLAYAPQDIIDTVIERHLHDFEPKELQSLHVIHDLFVRIRASGFYQAIGESAPEAYSISAPIFEPDGGVNAVLAIGGLISTLRSTDEIALLKLVLDAAAEISSRLR